MSAHTDHQIIMQNGVPAFAVIPWNEYQKLVSKQTEEAEKDIWFPNDVVKATSRGDSLIKAWREHFGLSQGELAAKAGISESILVELESNAVSPKKTDLAKLAKAMEIDKKQLID
jgi:ribosome-binding protein aMBF1 (putative translation factor)